MNTFSRFSVLSPEVDLDSAHRVKTKKRQDKNKKENNNNDKVQSKNVKTTAPANIPKKKKNDLQALAFGFGKPMTNKKGGGNVNKENKEKSSNKNNKKGKAPTVNGAEVKNDEDWQKRDEKFIKDQNEKSLREAILQSKLDFEEKKKTDEEIKQEEKEREKNAVTKGSKSKKKKEKQITISLDQFNSLQPKELANLRDPNYDPEEGKPQVIDPTKFNEEKFFKDVEEATRKTLEKEHRQEQYKANANKVNHEIQVKKFISEIEKRDYEIQALRLEVDSIQSQMHAVKSRNKKLCEVISFSEMRSKGELVVELEKVTRGRDEFSEDIVRLSGELEQERTKVSHLTTELKKMQGKKRNPDSSGK